MKLNKGELILSKMSNFDEYKNIIPWDMINKLKTIFTNDEEILDFLAYLASDYNSKWLELLKDLKWVLDNYSKTKEEEELLLRIRDRHPILEREILFFIDATKYSIEKTLNSINMIRSRRKAWLI